MEFKIFKNGLTKVWYKFNVCHVYFSQEDDILYYSNEGYTQIF